jgi:hypothetical protein
LCKQQVLQRFFSSYFWNEMISELNARKKRMEGLKKPCHVRMMMNMKFRANERKSAWSEQAAARQPRRLPPGDLSPACLTPSMQKQP